MRVLQLVVPARDAELGADRLWSVGARAVEEVDLAGDEVGLRSVLGDEEVASSRLGELPTDWRVEWLDVDDAPSEAWRRFAAPIDVEGRLMLRPAWLPGTDDGRLAVVIEPAGSFGLGDHPTTRLSAAAVLRLVTPGCSVLDVGCGSGVLGIVAARLGAASVTGIDIADVAVAATLDNARRNGVADRVRASTTPVAQVGGRYDVVLANVLAPELVAMAPHLRRAVAPGGALVVSGVLAEGHDHVVAALAPLHAVRTDELDGWAAVELRE